MFLKRATQIDNNSYSGKRHYNQSHRKTSLFGSENESQDRDLDFTENRIDAATNDGRKNLNLNGNSQRANDIKFEYQIKNNSNGSNRQSDIKNNNGTDDCLNEMIQTTNSLINTANCRAMQRAESRPNGRIAEQIVTNKSTTLVAPWYTDPDEKMCTGVNKTSGRTADSDKNAGPWQDRRSGKLGPDNEPKISGDSPIRKGQPESLRWRLESRNNGDDPFKPYKRQSYTAGDSFMKLFGVNSQASDPCKDEVDEKQTVKSQANASSLLSTPYAQHYDD